jgi:lipopolysaccharide transport system permease protein
MNGAPTREPVVLIQPPRGWSSLGLHDLWEYRELLHFLIWRDIKTRYRQMALGPLWILIMPVANMIVFSLIFGSWAQMPNEGIPYPLFYYAALLPWQLFSVSAAKSATSLAYNLNLISKVYFPRLVMPISTAATGLLDFAIAFIVLAGMMVGYRVAPQAAAAFLPLYLLLALAAALAVGLWLAAVAVRFRDVAYGVTYLMQIWMFATVLYPGDHVPAGIWRTLYRLNPMQTVVEGFRWGLFGRGHGPDLIQGISVLLVILFLVSGGYVFRRTERSVVDLL